MKVTVFGANSAIAQAICFEILKNNQGSRFTLFGRNEESLKLFKEELLSCSATDVEIFINDFVNSNLDESILEKTYNKNIDITILSYGDLGEEELLKKDQGNLRNFIDLNLTSKFIILNYLSNKANLNKNNSIVVISSVAGDRGRRSNYIYGSMNAALTQFTSGMRSFLHQKNVHVLTVKPGFIITPMTKKFRKSFLWSKPEKIAPSIYNAITKKKEVIYAPKFWHLIMLIIKVIPEKIFKKINF